jgi:hypothetical protein
LEELELSLLHELLLPLLLLLLLLDPLLTLLLLLLLELEESELLPLSSSFIEFLRNNLRFFALGSGDDISFKYEEEIIYKKMTKKFKLFFTVGVLKLFR